MTGDRNSGGGQPRKLTEAEKSRLLLEFLKIQSRLGRLPMAA